MNEDPPLDRARIEDAFRNLGERLARRGVVADLYIFGDAAMALQYDPRRAVRAVDAVMHPHGVVLQEAQATADDLALPRGWLRKQIGADTVPGGDAAAPRVFDHPALRVAVASPEHLLTMKVLAARSRESDDIRILMRHLALTTTAQALALCAWVSPDDPVPARAHALLQSVLNDEA